MAKKKTGIKKDHKKNNSARMKEINEKLSKMQIFIPDDPNENPEIIFEDISGKQVD